MSRTLYKTVYSLSKRELRGHLTILKRDEVPDTLPELIMEDCIPVKWSRHNLLLIGRYASIVWVKVYSSVFMLTDRWVPLWRFNDWEDCFYHNWCDVYPESTLFAIPVTIKNAERTIKRVLNILVDRGFITTRDTEGF